MEIIEKGLLQQLIFLIPKMKFLLEASDYITAGKTDPNNLATPMARGRLSSGKIATRSPVGAERNWKCLFTSISS